MAYRCTKTRGKTSLSFHGVNNKATQNARIGRFQNSSYKRDGTTINNFNEQTATHIQNNLRENSKFIQSTITNLSNRSSGVGRPVEFEKTGQLLDTKMALFIASLLFFYGIKCAGAKGLSPLRLNDPCIYDKLAYGQDNTAPCVYLSNTGNNYQEDTSAQRSYSQTSREDEDKTAVDACVSNIELPQDKDTQNLLREYLSSAGINCPTKAQIKKASAVASVAKAVLKKLARSLSKTDLQAYDQVVGPVVAFIANSVNEGGLRLDTKYRRGLNDLPKVILYTSLPRVRESSDETTASRQGLKLTIPRNLIFQDDKLMCYVKGKYRPLRHKKSKLETRIGKHYVPVLYSVEDHMWYLPDEEGTLISNFEEHNHDNSPTSSSIPRFLTKGSKPLLEPKKVYALNIKTGDTSFSTTARINSIGLLEQQGFPDKLYHVVQKNWSTELAFGDTKFQYIDKMINDNALIVSETLDGALRRLIGKTEPHDIYQIDGHKVKGVSLKNNIKYNPDGLLEFLNLEPLSDNKYDIEVGTGGALAFDEAHIYADDIDKTEYLGSSAQFENRIKELSESEW